MYDLGKIRSVNLYSDTPSRLGILRANLRKTLIAKDVDLNYISQITDGF